MNVRAALTRARGSKPLRRIAVLVVTYVALGWAFSFATRSRGLLSPGGSPHPDMVILGVVYLLTRVVVRFAVPALVAYQLAARLLARLTGE